MGAGVPASCVSDSREPERQRRPREAHCSRGVISESFGIDLSCLPPASIACVRAPTRRGGRA
eukprot:817671-Prymnesium_polylepis.3